MNAERFFSGEKIAEIGSHFPREDGEISGCLLHYATKVDAFSGAFVGECDSSWIRHLGGNGLENGVFQIFAWFSSV